MRRSYFAILAVSASTVALALPANAQTSGSPTSAAASDAAQADAAPETQIVVTGSRAINRTVSNSPVPIDVISNAALSSGGTTEVNTALNQLVPSFNFPRPSIADGSDVIRPATLRGLSPDQTLVLVNGKRRHVSSLLNINGTVGRGSAAVDLNTIPALAVERIEVLRDGAASQYGSDAIAGVINLQLKKANHGGKASIAYGKYITTLDGVANVTGLQGNGTQAIVDPADSRYLLANTSGTVNRHDGDSWTMGMNIGLPIGEGYLNITGEYRDRAATNRAGFDLRPNYVRPTTAYDPRELTFNRLDFKFGDPKTSDVSIFVNAGVPIGDFELYSFGSYGRRTGLSAANFRQQSNAANRDFSQISPSTTPSAANFVAIYPDGFLPKIGSKYVDYSAAVGIKGDVGGFKVDLSGVYGHNMIDYQTLDSISTTFGPNGLRDVDSGGIRYGQFTGNLDVSKEVESGFAQSLTIAFGAEYRHENFQERPGQFESYGAGPFTLSSIVTTSANCSATGGVYNIGTGVCSYPGRVAAIGQQGFPGIPASAKTNNSRHSYAVYAEVDADISDAFTVTAAGRYEHFSDFGGTLNGKLAARYSIIPQLGIRASISNGFRAPSLHQQFFTTTSTNFVGGFPVDIVTAQVNSPIALALGAQPLKPEKSVNISAGITANPFSGFTLTADVYRIKITNRIVLTENLGASGNAITDAAARTALNANGFSQIGAARFFINGLDTTTKGVDVVATYRADLAGMGIWSLSAAYNYTDNKINRRLNNSGTFASTSGLVLFGRVEGIRFEDGQPADKVVLAADGKIGDFGINLRTTRYGSVVNPAVATPIANPLSLTDSGPDDLFLKAKWISDLSVSYTFKEHATLTLGADNVFDVYPTRNPFGPRPASVGGLYPVSQQYLPYTGFSPFGFNGRYLYFRFTAQF